MKLALAVAADADAWRKAFAAALPEYPIACWPDVPAEVDCALVWKAGAETFDRMRVRRAIFNLGAGVDALLALPNLPAGVPIYRLEDAGMAVQMAEYTVLAVLRAYRELDAYAQSQREARWTQRPRLDKAAFGVGILGFGLLGRAVAGALTALGFPVSAYSRTPRPAPDVSTFSGPVAPRAFLERSRVLVVLAPSTAQSRGSVDARLLSQLPRGAHLVNLSRGDLIDEEAVLAALDSGQLASATLDVFRTEPLPPGHPFWHHPRVVVTPHVSAATAIVESAEQVAAKIRALARGESIGGRVDPAAGY